MSFVIIAVFTDKNKQRMGGGRSARRLQHCKHCYRYVCASNSLYSVLFIYLFYTYNNRNFLFTADCKRRET